VQICILEAAEDPGGQKNGKGLMSEDVFNKTFKKLAEYIVGLFLDEDRLQTTGKIPVECRNKGW